MRLLTLTGVGGVGKSRLALEVVRSVAGQVAFVELATVAREDGAVVPHVVASTLGVAERPGEGELQSLVTAIGSRRLLLVLDNCEHLLEACSDLADVLLRDCPRVRLLTTSREPLGMRGEVVWRVAGLPVPDRAAHPPTTMLNDYEAVRLFVERALAALPSFQLQDGTAAAVADVCARLDGIPLAIELAAARVRVLPPEQIAARLDDRFHLLTDGGRALLPRHQTLRAAVDWSYAMLSPAERQVLNQFSVFAGGWTLEAAEAVCAAGALSRRDVLDVLSRLVDKSLVQAGTVRGGTWRYRLLETIREYAAQRLEFDDDPDAVRERHRTWCLALGDRALDDFWRGIDVVDWLERLEQEQPNFRAALNFSLQRGDAEQGLRLASEMWVLWGLRGSWSEGRDWITRLLALGAGSVPAAARADALGAAGQLAFQQGDITAAYAVLMEAIGLQRAVGDPRGLAMTATHAGLAARARGLYSDALALHEEALSASRLAGNRRWEAVSLAAASHALYLQGAYERARTLAEASLGLVRASGRAHGVVAPDLTIPHYVLGRVALCVGDVPAARAHLEANLAVWRATGDARSTIGALVGLACADVLDGRSASARDRLTEALAIANELGSRIGLANALEGFAILAAVEMRDERALCLAAAAAALRREFDHPLSPAERDILEPALSKARARLDTAAAAAAWAQGSDAAEFEAVELAQTEARAPIGGRSRDTLARIASELTPREEAVARLIARGLTNPQIGVELTISSRTAQRHVENILRKLSLGGRAEVAAWAVTRGLAPPAMGHLAHTSPRE